MVDITTICSIAATNSTTILIVRIIRPGRNVGQNHEPKEGHKRHKGRPKVRRNDSKRQGLDGSPQGPVLVQQSLRLNMIDISLQSLR